MDVTLKHPDQRKGWLWWLAAIAILSGGTASYFLFQGINPETHKIAVIVLTITLLTTGTCIICATSEWWMHR